MDALVEVKNLSFAYEKENILNDLTFTIYRGEYVGIIGSNGAGKTTLIKVLLGQLKANSGEIRLFGDSRIEEGLKKIAYVVQVGTSRGLDFPATVEEIVLENLFQEIGLMRFPKKVHRDRVRQVLDLVDMGDFLKRKISDLSGGQQQRVIIARALVSKPEILFLDEPTSGIDYKSEDRLYQLLDKLNREMGITIIMISHDLVFIKNRADKIINLDKQNILDKERWLNHDS